MNVLQITTLLNIIKLIYQTEGEKSVLIVSFLLDGILKHRFNHFKRRTALMQDKYWCCIWIEPITTINSHSVAKTRFNNKIRSRFIGWCVTRNITLKVQSVRQPVSSSCHLKAADRGRSGISVLSPVTWPRHYLGVSDTSPGHQRPRAILGSGHTETQAGRSPWCQAEVSAPADPDMFLRANQMSVSVCSAANQKPGLLPDPRHDPVHREPGPGARPAAAVVAWTLVAEVDLRGRPENNVIIMTRKWLNSLLFSTI